MSYIKSYSQINEELKRKLSPSALRKQMEDEETERLEKRPADLFSEEEIRILKNEDFEIEPNEKEAKNVEKLATFTIKKSFDLNDEVLFTLTIKDNRSGENTYERKIKVSKRSQHKDTLDFMLDKCAYIIHNMKEKAMKGIDPYGEEEWTEEERNKILGIEPEKPKKVEKTKKKKSEDDFLRDLLDLETAPIKKKKKEEPYIPRPRAGFPNVYDYYDMPDEQLEDEEIPNVDEQNRKEQLIQSQDTKVVQKLENEFSEDDLIDMNYETLKEIIDDIKQEMEENDRWWYSDEDKKNSSTPPEKKKKSKKIEPIPDLSGSMKSAEKHWKDFEKTYVKKAKDFEEKGKEIGYDLVNKETNCPTCGGKGYIMSQQHDSNIKLPVPCSSCSGTGKITYQEVRPKGYTRSDIEFDIATGLHHDIPKAAKKPKKDIIPKKEKEIECYSCKGWGQTDDGKCYRCGGTGRIKVDKDYKGPTWSIGGASDYSYGS